MASSPRNSVAAPDPVIAPWLDRWPRRGADPTLVGREVRKRGQDRQESWPNLFHGFLTQALVVHRLYPRQRVAGERAHLDRRQCGFQVLQLGEAQHHAG